MAILTREDRELLLKDLCARSPYFVQVNINGEIQTLNSWADDDGNYFNFLSDESDGNYGEGFTLDEVKPYLRPMSSMTKEEKEEYRKACELDTEILSKHPMDETPFPALYNSQDWLNENHFDYRGLIPKGLAIAVTKENNPYK